MVLEIWLSNRSGDLNNVSDGTFVNATSSDHMLHVPGLLLNFRNRLVTSRLGVCSGTSDRKARVLEAILVECELRNLSIYKRK